MLLGADCPRLQRHREDAPSCRRGPSGQRAGGAPAAWDGSDLQQCRPGERRALDPCVRNGLSEGVLFARSFVSRAATRCAASLMPRVLRQVCVANVSDPLGLTYVA